jgi:hypothetical protein
MFGIDGYKDTSMTNTIDEMAQGNTNTWTQYMSISKEKITCILLQPSLSFIPVLGLACATSPAPMNSP